MKEDEENWMRLQHVEAQLHDLHLHGRDPHDLTEQMLYDLLEQDLMKEQMKIKQSLQIG